MTNRPTGFERVITPYGSARSSRRTKVRAALLGFLAFAVAAAVVITNFRGPLGTFLLGAGLLTLSALFFWFWWQLMGITYRWLLAKDWTDGRRYLVYYAVFFGVVIGLVAGMGILIEAGN